MDKDKLQKEICTLREASKEALKLADNMSRLLDLNYSKECILDVVRKEFICASTILECASNIKQIVK